MHGIKVFRPIHDVLKLRRFVNSSDMNSCPGVLVCVHFSFLLSHYGTFEDDFLLRQY